MFFKIETIIIAQFSFKKKKYFFDLNSAENFKL